MHQYQDALHHLNLALDAVIAQGDTAAIASIAAPIALIERVIINRRIEMIATACPPPTMMTAVE